MAKVSVYRQLIEGNCFTECYTIAVPRMSRLDVSQSELQFLQTADSTTYRMMGVLNLTSVYENWMTTDDSINEK